ncbi:hypothetical protein M413DRAFT_255845, partial [Hebeloma cylindrosporum]
MVTYRDRAQCSPQRYLHRNAFAARCGAEIEIFTHDSFVETCPINAARKQRTRPQIYVDVLAVIL